MSNIFDSLNLSPQERRVVMGAVVVVFILLNVWLVFPHFSDWKDIQKQHDDAAAQLEKHEKQVAQKPALLAEIDRLEQMGPGIQLASANAASALQSTINALTRKNSIILRNNSSKSVARGTNDYFEESARSLTFEADTEQLVGFLHSLGDSNTMVRVPDMMISPNAQLSKLTVNLSVVASFQKDGPSPSNSKAK